MSHLENIATAVRHNHILKNAHWLWNSLRPFYEWSLSRLNHKGLKRTINGIDTVFVASRARAIATDYEPEVWHALMQELQPKDVIADVGAFIGLYTVVLAQRIGNSGKVIAFEPDAANCALLKEHLRLNGVEDRVEVLSCAVGSESGRVQFQSGSHSESHIIEGSATSSKSIEVVTLDQVFAGRKLDILKIDVEGYEEKVLQGAIQLLTDRERSPRVLYIEVHPYAWQSLGLSGESLLTLLKSLNYHVTSLDGTPLDHIAEYGEIIARRGE